MRDGTIVRVPQDGALPEIDLRAAFKYAEENNQGTVEISLAVPILDLGRPNVTAAGGEAARYRVEIDNRVPDESDGKTERPLQYRRLNLTVLTSGTDPAGYETLPIAVLQYLQYHIDPLVAAVAVAQVVLVGGALLLLDRLTPVSRVIA